MTGNALTLTSASFDTTAEKFGSAALSAGYGLASTGLTALPQTIECWVKASSPGANICVAMGQYTNGAYLGMAATTGYAQFSYTNSSNVAVTLANAVSIADGNWHHLAGVLSSSSGMFFVDGVLIATGAAPKSSYILTTIAVGNDYGAVPNYSTFQWPGEIDEAAVWNIAKYSATFTPPTSPYAGNETGLVQLWHLDGNGNTGIITAAPVNSAVPAVTPTGGAVGTVFTSTPGTWTQSPASYAYQWYSAGVAISGSTGSTYTAAGSDVGNALTCKVVATNAIGSSAAATSNATSAITASATVPVNSTAPAVTPTSGSVGTAFTSTSGAWTQSPTGYTYQWYRGATAISGATSATYTAVSGDIGSALSCQVIASNATGASSPATSNTTSAITGPVTIAPNNAAIAYSPYNWLVGSTSAKTICGGAYLKVAFTGTTCALTFDTSGDTGSYLPQIWYRIDGLYWTEATIASSVTCTMPSESTAWPKHTLEVVVKSTSEFQTRWTPQNTAVVLTGIVLDSGASVSLPVSLSKHVIVFGDSITEGYHAINANGSGANDPAGSDARGEWSFMLKDLLGVEVGVVGFGGIGLAASGQGGVPGLMTSYPNLWSGQTRTFSPVPDLIVINIGENDGSVATATEQANYVTLLNGLLTACPGTPIAALRPFSGKQAAAIQGAIALCNNPSLVTYIDTTGFFDTTLSVDGQHPLGVANIQTIAPSVAGLLRPLLGSAGASGTPKFANRFD